MDGGGFIDLSERDEKSDSSKREGVEDKSPFS